MAGVPIPWPLSTSPGQKFQEGRGRLINCYAEPLGEGQGAVYHRAPGARAYGAETASEWSFWGLGLQWFNAQETPLLAEGLYRGGIALPAIAYAVFGENLYRVDEGGAFVKIGEIAGTDKVFFARNNALITDVVVVASVGVFVVSPTGLAAYPDLDVGSPTCVVGHEGFIIFGYGNGDMISTNVNTTDINLLNLARTETNPDGVEQLVSYSGQLYAFGTTTVEVFGGAVNTTGFPFTRVGYNIVPGLRNDHAIAGFEPEFGQPPIYVGSDHTVRWLAGDQAKDITTPDLSRLLESVGELSQIEALCYVIDGVPFWQVSGPTFTWVFNCANQKWHERRSYLSTRSRLTGSLFAFRKWLCGDTEENGYFLEVTNMTAKEIADPFIVEMDSLPVADFPNAISVSRADFEFTPGTGDANGHDPDETNPKALIFWSDDGGLTWLGPRETPIGRQAKAKTLATVWRTGLSGPQGRRWRLAFPAAVHFGFVGGTMKAATQQY